MTNKTKILSNRTVLYIGIVFLSLLGAFLLPDLLKYVLFFCSDRTGLPYDYFSHRQNQAYVITTIVEILLFFCIYKALFFHNERSKRASCQAKDILKFIVLPSFGINGLSLLWVLSVEHIAKSIPVLQGWLSSFNQNMDSLETEGYVWLFLVTCLVAPILEELIFRGVIFNALKRVFPHALFPLLISGIAFGVWHFNVVQSVYTAAMGIILAMVYEKTRDLKYPIAIHMMNNMLSTLPPPVEKTVVPEFLGVVSIVMVIPLIFVIQKEIRGSRKS